MPNHTLVCPEQGENCTSSEETTQKTPITEIEQCECFPKCSGYRFRLAAHEKLSFELGTRVYLIYELEIKNLMIFRQRILSKPSRK